MYKRQVFIQYQRVTDRQTDGRTDRIGISISRVSSRMLTRRMLTRDKNYKYINKMIMEKLKEKPLSGRS